MDFKSAFKDGIEAARKAETAKREIKSVFNELNEQLAEVSDGRLRIEIEELERPLTGVAALTRFLEPPKKYTVVAASNPTIETSPLKELAEWEMDRNGYPCKLTWGDKEEYCEDKKALEDYLAELLRDPVIAQRLSTLMNLKNTGKGK